MLPWNENWNFNDFIWVFVGLCWFRHNQLYCHLKSVPKIQWTCRGQEITEILPPDMMSGMFWFLPACLPDIFYDNGTAVFESAKYGVQSGRLICTETGRDQIQGSCPVGKYFSAWHYLLFYKKVVFKKVLLDWPKPSKNLREFLYVFLKLKKVYQKFFKENYMWIKILRKS